MGLFSVGSLPCLDTESTTAQVALAKVLQAVATGIMFDDTNYLCCVNDYVGQFDRDYQMFCSSVLVCLSLSRLCRKLLTFWRPCCLLYRLRSSRIEQPKQRISSLLHPNEPSFKSGWSSSSSCKSTKSN